ncbi:THUMP domain-containing protein [archaeon]
MTLFLVRYGELFLKSEPVKRQFEQRLLANIGAGIPGAKITRRRGRILVEADSGETLGKIFGIVSYSPVHTCESTLEAMKKVVVPLVHEGTFALRINRPFKGFPKTSQEIAIELGSAVVEAKGNKVNLSSPDQAVFVEVFEDVTYIFTETIPGPGGLPLGTSGRLLLLNDGKNAERAGWMMMKRGCTIDVLGEKSELLDEWSIGQKVNYVKGNTDELMKDYPALVSGSRELPTEQKPYPVFQPLLGI